MIADWVVMSYTPVERGTVKNSIGLFNDRIRAKSGFGSDSGLPWWHPGVADVQNIQHTKGDDGIHFTAGGYQQIGNTIYGTIESLLPSKVTTP
jgi:lysophospholipase L1-like esterase